MSDIQASCPACGGTVTFTVSSSVVTVCPYCRSVVARGDRKLEDLGKVAEIMQTDSPLEIGMKGRYRGVPFHLTGRAQLGHPAGGMWDEWYAAFADGRWGWLAEAQGRFYMTFPQELPPDHSLPNYEELPLGEPVTIAPGTALMVAEKGWAKPLAAEGEIPYRLEPGISYAYADLSGAEGEFGTLDYSEGEPLVFVGEEVTLDDLGVPPGAKARFREARRVEALHLNCPNCGGGLELRAPDQSERVACPSCGSLLDVNQGELRFFKALEPPAVVPILPLGAKGKLPDGEMTIIGFLQRSVKVEGKWYPWEEYLLYNPRIGFRWLVRSDNHWNFVRPLPPGAVKTRGSRAEYDGKTYKVFQRAPARVDVVLGEFYWKVEVGERVSASDYIRPPEMLSKEVSKDEDEGASGEINWSHGTYLPRAEVEQAFGLEHGLPRPWTVAPNQPFVYKKIYPYWGILAAGAVLCLLLVLLVNSRRKVFEQTYTIQPPTVPNSTRIFFTEPLELKPRQNIRVTAEANVNNSWVYLQGDLIEEQSGLVQSFDIPLEYYHGIEGGESWSEGSRSSSVYLSALPAGQYTLRLDFSHAQWSGQPITATVRVEQGVPHLLNWFLLLGAISLVPLGIVAYHLYFEHQRWQDSNCR